MLSVIALRARISETTPRDLCGVDLLTRLAQADLGVTPVIIEGRRSPFGHTPWQTDLDASRGVLNRVAGEISVRLAAGERPLILASDCSLALASLPAVAAQRPDARVLWLDAHSDYDTPDTTSIGFLGCMSLAGATGAWDTGFGAPIAAERVVLAGVRGSRTDFDGAGRAAVDASPVTVLEPGRDLDQRVLAALGSDPIWLHLDPDVLDPSQNPLPYARPGGLTLDQLGSLIRRVADNCGLIGGELTAFHVSEQAAQRHALGRGLIDCIAPLWRAAMPPA